MRRYHDSDDDDSVLARRRQAKRNRSALMLAWLGVGVFAVVVCATAVGAVLWSRKSGEIPPPQAFNPVRDVGGAVGGAVAAGPSAEKDGADWNHDEMLRYLNAHGGKEWKMARSISRGGLAAYFYIPDGGWNDENLETWALDRELEAALRRNGHDNLIAIKTPDRQIAKDASGLKPDKTHYWGSWLFEAGSKDMLTVVRKALPR